MIESGLRPDIPSGVVPGSSVSAHNGTQLRCCLGRAVAELVEDGFGRVSDVAF